MSRLFYIIFYCILIFIPLQSWSQITQSHQVQLPDDSTSIEVILLDSIVFNPNALVNTIEDLITLIQRDTTFYKAFKNLHFNTYNADHKVVIYDKKSKLKKASLTAETKHIYRNSCRWMNVLEEHISGNYLNKKGLPNYHTTSLYNDLFYNKDTVCNEKNILDRDYFNPAGNTLERNKAQLKLLMFNPGARIKGIPFIGNKASIFDPEIAQYYNFTMQSVTKNGVPCYLFQASPKKGKENKVIYKDFKTWFDAYDFHIVARNYHLQFDANVYDFDVKIEVDLIKKDNIILVQKMDYKGNWRVISQGRELVDFHTIFYH